MNEKSGVAGKPSIEDYKAKSIPPLPVDGMLGRSVATETHPPQALCANWKVTPFLTG